MNLTRGQLLSIAFFTAFFLVIYVGCDTKSKTNKALEKSRAQNLELISIDRVMQEKRESISARAKSELMILEEKYRSSDSDSSKTGLLKSMASLWYSEGHPLVSAHFAEEVANLNSNEDAWSIAGTTYAIAVKNETDENLKQHAVQKSRMAFENALSINSENIDNNINLALSYVDVPEETNPMKGILMLIDLNKQNPNNSSVLFQLGRLALGTNQLDKAVERLSQVVELDKNNTKAYCLLAEAFQKKGETAKAAKALENCSINKN